MCVCVLYKKDLEGIWCRQDSFKKKIYRDRLDQVTVEVNFCTTESWVFDSDPVTGSKSIALKFDF